MLPDGHSFVDALEALLQSAATGSLAAWLAREAKAVGGKNTDVAPLIEVAALTPGTLADIRIAGVKHGVTAAVRYTPPDPWTKTGGKRPSGKEMDAWAAKVKKQRADGDFERYGRISARTILHIGGRLGAR